MIQGLENLPYEERVEEFGLLEEVKSQRRYQSILVLKGCLQRDREPHGVDKGQWVQVTPGEVSYERHFLQ